MQIVNIRIYFKARECINNKSSLSTRVHVRVRTGSHFLTEHASVWVSTSSPPSMPPSQSLPPNSGGGASHLLVRSRVPFPHVRSQYPHGVQLDQRPSTAHSFTTHWAVSVRSPTHGFPPNSCSRPIVLINTHRWRGAAGAHAVELSFPPYKENVHIPKANDVLRVRPDMDIRTLAHAEPFIRQLDGQLNTRMNWFMRMLKACRNYLRSPLCCITLAHSHELCNIAFTFFVETSVFPSTPKYRFKS